MIIHVTQEDIDQGARKDCRACPIGLAVERESGWTEVMVGFPTISGLKGNYRLVRPTPYDAQLFIWSFDRGEPVRPFEFELQGG